MHFPSFILLTKVWIRRRSQVSTDSKNTWLSASLLPTSSYLLSLCSGYNVLVSQSICWYLSTRRTCLHIQVVQKVLACFLNLSSPALTLYNIQLCSMRWNISQSNWQVQNSKRLNELQEVSVSIEFHHVTYKLERACWYQSDPSIQSRDEVDFLLNFKLQLGRKWKRSVDTSQYVNIIWDMKEIEIILSCGPGELRN